MAKINEPQGPIGVVSQIANGTEIRGEVVCNGDLRIDGMVDGSIEASGKVVIGAAGQVYGSVQCRNADLSGFLKGTIEVKELFSMKSTARMEGEITTQKLAIESGCVFSGKCNMGTIDDPRSAETKPQGEKKRE